MKNKYLSAMLTPILLAMVLLFMSIGTASAKTYTITNESYTQVWLGNPGSALTQTFTTTDQTLTLNNVDLLVGAYKASTSVDAYVEIRSDSPTGSLIETSGHNTISQQRPDTWVTFHFSGAQKLNANTTYCLVLRHDSDKYLITEVSNANPVSGEFSYYDGSSWSDCGSFDMAYRVNTTLPISADATLSGLSLSIGKIAPDFASGTTEYAANVSNSISSITITPTANESHATITVNGVAVAGGQASGSISLSEGANTLTVVVKAEDGTMSRTYKITVSRAAAPAATAAYAIKNEPSTQEVWLGYPGSAMAQTFITADQTLMLNSVDLLVGAYEASTSEDAYVEIRAGSPTGSLIETSEHKIVSQQEPESWVTFNFSGTQELSANTTYCLVVRHDSTKYLITRASNSNPVSGKFSYYDGSSWNDFGGNYDMAYRVNATIATFTASSTTITSSINPSNAGVEVSFRATVSPGAATGTVTFMDGTASLGWAVLSRTGSVTTVVYKTSALAAGSHSITAVYNGDSNYGSSTSKVLIQTVKAKPASVATKVEVSGPNEITIPTSGTASETYSAVVKDQYGVVMTGKTVSWSISPSTGVSIDANGIVTISASASAGYYDVCAADGGVSGGCVVKLKT